MSNWKKGKQLNDGRYTIESILLRSSGNGVLSYRAKNNQTNKLVTIKVIPAVWRQQPHGEELENKLIQQARQISKCEHPYLIKLYPEIGEEGDNLYMVMDYLEGEDLASYIDHNGKLDEYSALKIVSKIGSAVNILHKNKCVHQDIKPQNIIMDKESGQPILIDYGSAIKLFTMGDKGKENTTTDYFSPPEKYEKSVKIAPYFDIYSLAATLYVLVTAQLPHPSKLRKYQDLIPPQKLNPDLSDCLNQAIIKGMALNPAQRPQYLRDWFQLLKETEKPTVIPQKVTNNQNIKPPLDDDDDEDTAPLISIAQIKEEETVIQKTPLTNNNLINNNYEETVIQKTPMQKLHSGSNSPQPTYPHVETFNFETIIIEPKKQLFGLVNGVEKNLIPKESKFFVEYIGEGVNLDMVFIPSGTFVMGSGNNEFGREKDESPTHRVKLDSFYMSKYPITQLQWRVVISNYPKVKRPIKNNPSFFKGDDLPVEKVSWLDAQEFCQRLSKHTGRKYRLPTETEWEYACRGGTQTPFFFGNIITNDFANYDGREGYGFKPTGKYEKKTTSVGSFAPNPFGLYDVHGNVWEWCEDHYMSNYIHKPKDGSAFYSNVGNHPRVVRGGSWSLAPSYCRSAKRSSHAADSNYNFLGFRVVCVID